MTQEVILLAEGPLESQSIHSPSYFYVVTPGDHKRTSVANWSDGVRRNNMRVGRGDTPSTALVKPQ